MYHFSNHTAPSRQQGFIQAAILFGIALLATVIGGFALANRSPSINTAAEQVKVNASVILKQASDLSEGAARYVVEGGSMEVLDFSSGNNGLFNPTKQLASPQVAPKTAFSTYVVTALTGTTGATTAGTYSLNRNLSLPGIGTTAGDRAIVVVGLTADVCKRINNLLYGDALTSPPPTAGVSGSSLSSNTNDTAQDVSGLAGFSGRPEACFQASGDNSYVYYKAVQEL